MGRSLSTNVVGWQRQRRAQSECLVSAANVGSVGLTTSNDKITELESNLHPKVLMNISLYPFIIIAAIGFVLSLVTHLMALAGKVPPGGGLVWGLHIGIFAVWPILPIELLSTNYLPHAFCYLRSPGLVWTHVSADLLIGVSYLAISVTLGYLGYKGRRDVPYHWMFLAFGLFILGCAGTHFVEAVTVWIPVYVLSAAVKLFTAAVSLTTAAVLPFTVQHAFDLIRQARATEQRTAELRASEERKDALLQEVHHRVKNNMAVICSLFDLQSIHTKNQETAQIFRDMENRVHSMALVHENGRPRPL